MRTKPKIAVAMSGGVDSSLAAALLARDGWDVIGVTMLLSDDSREGLLGGRNGAVPKSVSDARRVAYGLGIKHYVMDFREMFRQKVVDYFIAEYARGRTPNPCIMCNRHVKFAGLWQRCREIGATHLATGHYARLEQDAAGEHRVRQGMDAQKDQSYMLCRVDRNLLPYLMLPLGPYSKAQTREMAKKFNLPVADKPDSQEICFVPNDDYKSYLAQKAPAMLRAGDIVDRAGRVLGCHKGVPLYTVGQRKGLGLAARTPLYVVGLDMQRSRVIVGENKDTFSRELIAGDLNWLTPDEPLLVKAKVRYGMKEVEAKIVPFKKGLAKVIFAAPQRAVTPGQSVVFYDGERVLGGGTILRAWRNAENHDRIDF